jgi:hypothetical protein
MQGSLGHDRAGAGAAGGLGRPHKAVSPLPGRGCCVASALFGAGRSPSARGEPVSRGEGAVPRRHEGPHIVKACCCDAGWAPLGRRLRLHALHVCQGMHARVQSASVCGFPGDLRQPGFRQVFAARVRTMGLFAIRLLGNSGSRGPLVPAGQSHRGTCQTAFAVGIARARRRRTTPACRLRCLARTADAREPQTAHA